MTISSEGIVFRQTKMPTGRNVVLIFTKEYGKISVGTNLDGRGKSRSSLAIRPFTYGSYQIYDGRHFYNLESTTVIKSYYAFGEELERYVAASYALELTDKLIQEDLPQPKAFSLLLEFLNELETRKKKHSTLVIAYEIKLLKVLGVAPVVDRCVICGKEDGTDFFSIRDGGTICKECEKRRRAKGDDRLIYDGGFDIVKVVNYFDKTPLREFSGIALEDAKAERLQRIVREYMEYHLDLGKLKSEGLFSVVGEESLVGEDK